MSKGVSESLKTAGDKESPAVKEDTGLVLKIKNGGDTTTGIVKVAAAVVPVLSKEDEN